MRLVLLLEKQDTGKSTTIGIVYEKLKKEIKPIWKKKPERPKDKLALFKYHNKTVGICCKGDTPDVIQNDLYDLFSHLKNKRMDILICSSRNADKNAFLNLKSIMDFINYNKINISKNVIEIISLDSIKYCSNNKTKKIPKDVAEKIFKSL